MAIRRPEIGSPNWLFQDFLYLRDGVEELRYILVKWDGERYYRISQTFDYSDPPYVGDEQRGGDIVARLEYSKVGKLITITDWEHNWRDEWPIRLANNYLVNCTYLASLGFVIRVVKSEADAMWISEKYIPTANDMSDLYLYYTP